jgi:prolyl oligopeptidase
MRPRKIPWDRLSDCSRVAVETPAKDTVEKLHYPATRRTETVDVCAGVSFPDPYHWLEEETEEVRIWQRAQGELATEYVNRWPHMESLKRSVAQFSVARFPSLPRYAGGYWFRISMLRGATQAQATVARSPNDPGRVIFNPVSESSSAPPFLSWISPSPDGRTLALGVCADGSEHNTMRLFDVETGRSLPNAPTQMLMDAWLGGAQWLADSSGFYYTALTGTAGTFEQGVFFHRPGYPPPIEPVPIPFPKASRDYRAVTISRCGRWAVAIHRLFTPTPVAFLDLTDGARDWQPFITDLDGTVAGHVLGNHYVAVTTVNAPRGRIVAIPLDSSTPNDPASWKEIVPESEAVIRTLTPVGDQLYSSEFVDTYARVRAFSNDGQLLGQVPLPGKGALAELPFPMMNLLPRGDSDSFVFGFSSLTESWGEYIHRPGADRIETVREPEVRIDNAVIEDHWAISVDGTRVPYHTVRLKRVELNQPQPALIYGYGGFNAPWIPQFPGPMAAFVAAGGIFVHTHLRGGSEFGLDWWEGGRLNNKQNGYADLYAIAEDLIAAGTTDAQHLGVTGGSNGGLMAGVAVTQRPDLWRVAVPRVPILDLIGSFRNSYGRYASTAEFGDPDSPDDVRRIAAYSPYHLVKADTIYPAVYLDAGDTDPRCPPSHARKFAAQLQAAQVGDAPILVHIWENVGHGWATAKDLQIQQSTEWLAFAMQQLGMGLG